MDNAAIRAFVGNGGLGCLPRADLPTRYRQAGPIHGPYHDWLIGYYMDRDHEQWAWDGLVALLSDLQRCEPVLLINWACRTLRTRHTRPTASKADGYIERRCTYPGALPIPFESGRPMQDGTRQDRQSNRTER